MAQRELIVPKTIQLERPAKSASHHSSL